MSKLRITLAVIAIALMAVPVHADDSQQVAVVYSNDVDGPAVTAATIAFGHGYGIDATLFDDRKHTPAGTAGYGWSCLLAIGPDADALADEWGVIADDVKTITGSDRYHTAEMVGILGAWFDSCR